MINKNLRRVPNQHLLTWSNYCIGKLGIEIIVIARTTRYNSLKEETPPLAYVPFTQDLEGLSRVEFELRTTGDPLAIANTIRGIVHEANAAVPMVSLTTQAATMDRTISEERTFAGCVQYLLCSRRCSRWWGSTERWLMRWHDAPMKLASGWRWGRSGPE